MADEAFVVWSITLLNGHIFYPDGKEAVAGLDWLLDNWIKITMVNVTKGRSSRRPTVLTARLEDRTVFEYPFPTKEECLEWIESHRDRLYGVKMRVFGIDQS